MESIYIENKEEMTAALQKGFIDYKKIASSKYVPELLTNDYSKKQKIITSICSSLNTCDEFYFAVAFITESGVASLINIFKELQEKNKRGIIVTSEYQKFTQPKALRTLLKLKNIDLHIVTEDIAKMHTKGYLFKSGQELTLIVGSSNLTQEALSLNKEWNIKLQTCESGSIAQRFLKEFQNLQNIAVKVTDKWIDIYEKTYNGVEFLRCEQIITQVAKEIKPNVMQRTALESLKLIRENPYLNKAIVVSATGTGKTYLAAFDVKEFNPERILFLVHREIIAKDAMSSFKRIVGNHKSMGFLGGGQKTEADYVFATVQTVSQKNQLAKIPREAFDYIIIDEVHRAGAKSYQRIFEHFKPKFWLGMSATPERTDGYNIYEMFDYNIACEIRLQDALKEELVVPFHYYGVSEFEVDDELIDDFTEFRHLISDKRVDHIIEKINQYGYSGKRVKGLIFCSRNEEASELSYLFNSRGYNTVALSGSNSHFEREYAISRLEQDEKEGSLDYIFTVDIFNEGVDIPAINQVVMLRPTQSSIIFVQQLGRGLRKLESAKEFLVVIDFIGNYQKNFMIPIALSGDRSYNKDNLRRIVSEGNSLIPGSSTINFEFIVKEAIYKAIDSANLGQTKILKEAYFELKAKIGKIPTMRHFLQYGSIDLNKIFTHHNLKSYHNFLKKYENEYSDILSEEEELYLEFISYQFGSGKRPHELEFIKLLIEDSENAMRDFENLMSIKYPNIKINANTLLSVYNQMSQKYLVGHSSEKYKKVVFLSEDGKGASGLFRKNLSNNVFKFKILELIDYALAVYEEKYSDNYKETNFNLYEKYTYSEVIRLLDWAKAEVAQNVGGYKYDEDTKTFPVFINYDKDEESISDSINYKDRFLSPEKLIAISKSRRNKDSRDVRAFVEAAYNGVKIPLFVRKNKDDKESSEFYFLGEMLHDNRHLKEIIMGSNQSNKQYTAVEIGYELKTPIRQDLYEYIVS